jgi:ribonuclease VapC
MSATLPADPETERLAKEVYMRYSKGIHATARLNLCDCVAYSLAKQRDVPLLFKGDDFAATDIAIA